MRALDRVSITVAPGQIVALVGESGSGKSVLLQAVLGLTRGHPGVVRGQVQLRLHDSGLHQPYEGIDRAVRVREQDGATRSVSSSFGWAARVERRARKFRGQGVELVLQNGSAALDPRATIGAQVRSAARSSEDDPLGWLEKLGFEEPRKIAAQYPHELSGGMAQRAMLAVALTAQPELLLLDEVTTGLDVSLQASVLAQLKALHQARGFSAVLITHDLGLARSISHKTVIMQRGRVVQTEDTQALFSGEVELQPYTRRLLETAMEPQVTRTLSSPDPKAQATVQTEALSKTFERGGVEAVRAVSVRVAPSECVALVGESGSGKTTLSRLVVGLEAPSTGEVRIEGQSLAELTGDRIAQVRKKRALLFQNPYTSLNPEETAQGALVESLCRVRGLDRAQALSQARQSLERFSLLDRAEQRLGALSGGERRRIGLLRTLSAGAELVVLDEPTAGLDAVHKADVAAMIRALRADRPQQSLLIVSHDLGFLSEVADRVIVMYRGSVVEEAPMSDFFDRSAAHHPYTQLLWDASRYVAGLREAPPADGAVHPVAGGCPFRPRCAIYNDDVRRWESCAQSQPNLVPLGPEQRVACHGVSR